MTNTTKCNIFVANDVFMKDYDITKDPGASLREPLAVYSRRTHFLEGARQEGFDADYLKSITFEDLMQNKVILLHLINTGISPAFFKAIVRQSPFNMTQWSEFLGISMRTIQRYIKDDKLLKPIHTEKIIEFLLIIRQGVETFGSVDKFSAWLCTPSYIFSGKKPCDLLTNSIGMRMVSDELINIEYGLFA